jgi:hypothetical protein
MTFCLPLAYWKEYKEKQQQKDLEQPLIPQVGQQADIPCVPEQQSQGQDCR